MWCTNQGKCAGEGDIPMWHVCTTLQVRDRPHTASTEILPQINEGFLVNKVSKVQTSILIYCFLPHPGRDGVTDPVHGHQQQVPHSLWWRSTCAARCPAPAAARCHQGSGTGATWPAASLQHVNMESTAYTPVRTVFKLEQAVLKLYSNF